MKVWFLAAEDPYGTPCPEYIAGVYSTPQNAFKGFLKYVDKSGIRKKTIVKLQEEIEKAGCCEWQNLSIYPVEVDTI
jgi:hypothetical protein